MAKFSIVSCQFMIIWFMGDIPYGIAYAANAEVVILDNFNAELNPIWRNEEFKGQTRYNLVNLDGDRVLQGESAGTASALVFKTKYRLQDYPVLSWRWKVADILEAGDARSKKTDDYAARVSVVFPHWFLPLTRSIQLPLGQ